MMLAFLINLLHLNSRKTTAEIRQTPSGPTPPAPLEGMPRRRLVPTPDGAVRVVL